MMKLKILPLFHRKNALNLVRKIQCKHLSIYSDDTKLSSYVQLPYSYTFGRSTRNVIYKTLGELMDERIEKDAGRPFVISHHEDKKIHYEEFYKEVNSLSMALYDELNIKRGDIVGIWCNNNYDWIVIQYACLRIGAILCTVNPYYRSHELDYAIRKGEMKALFLPGKQSIQESINSYSKTIRETLAKCNDNENSNELPMKLNYIINIDGEPYESNEFPSDLNIKTYELKKLRQYSKELPKEIVQSVSPDDAAEILFTSGTTGKPKGACLSHFTLLNNVSLVMSRFNLQNEVNLCLPLPFFHSFAGILGNFMPLIFSNALIIIPSLKYNLPELADSIQKHRATFLFATPTLAIDLLNYVVKKNLKITTLQSCIVGGAAVPEEIVYQFQSAIPSCTDFRIGYGATETGPGLSGNQIEDTVTDKAQTVGRPIDFVEVKIVDSDTQRLVRIGEIGEIHTRGHHVMMGYWKEPEKTANVLQNGWYNTEDLGTMDERGYIKIVGRSKEMVIVGGENVYPREIEEVLYMMPSVEIASVIGVPDERLGEALCAWVKFHTNVPPQSHDELREFCKQKLAYFKVPKYFLTVDDFPMTPTRKQQKFIMREMTIKQLNLKKK